MGELDNLVKVGVALGAAVSGMGMSILLISRMILALPPGSLSSRQLTSEGLDINAQVIVNTRRLHELHDEIAQLTVRLENLIIRIDRIDTNEMRIEIDNLKTRMRELADRIHDLELGK